jgi:hypothetical protein
LMVHVRRTSSCGFACASGGGSPRAFGARLFLRGKQRPLTGVLGVALTNISGREFLCVPNALDGSADGDFSKG